MDPSEFEGTITKEDLFDTEKPSFTSINLSKDVGEIYQSIYDLQQLLQQSSHIPNIASEAELLAIKITDMKEEYVQRRTHLRKVVKQFISTLNATADVPVSTHDEIVEIIELFKKEYDHVSSFSKLSEQGFLSLYTEIQNVPDYHHMLEKTFSQCLQLQDLLKRVQQQFTIAETLLSSNKKGLTVLETEEERKNQSSSSLFDNILQTNNNNELSPEQRRIIQEDCVVAVQQKEQELKEFYCMELLNQQKQYEQERRQLEQTIGEGYESKLLELHQSYEKTIHSKEFEIAMFAKEIAQYNLKKQYFEENQLMLKQEQDKKAALEDKLHQQILHNHDLSEEKLHWKKECEFMKIEQEKWIGEMKEAEKSLAVATAQYQQNLSAMEQRLSHQQTLLSAAPDPEHMEEFANKIGYYHDDDLQASITKNTNSPQPTAHIIPWSRIEQYVIATMRKMNQEMVSHRVENEQLSHAKQHLSDQFQEMQSKYNQLLASSTQNTITLSSKKDGPKVRWSNYDVVENGEEENDVEALLMLPPSPSSLEMGGKHDEEHSTASHKKIVHLLQKQRNHFQHIAQQMQSENAGLKEHLTNQQNEVQQLQQENVELYRRLRVLRLTTNNTSIANGGEQITTATSTMNDQYQHSIIAGKPTARRFNNSNDSAHHLHRLDQGNHFDNNHDALDQKYANLYTQQELTPYKILAYEKQQYWYSMSYLDRWMAWMYTNILQDPWARYAFLLYLLLLNICALMYVFQVINPSLVEEIDAHMKEKWSSETLNLPEHPDVT